MHTAEAAQEQIVTEAPVDGSEFNVPNLKKTAQVLQTRGTAARKGTPSSSKKQAKGKGKESDKPKESDDDDAVCGSHGSRRPQRAYRAKLQNPNTESINSPDRQILCHIIIP